MANGKWQMADETWKTEEGEWQWSSGKVEFVVAGVGGDSTYVSQKTFWESSGNLRCSPFFGPLLMRVQQLTCDMYESTSRCLFYRASFSQDWLNSLGVA